MIRIREDNWSFRFFVLQLTSEFGHFTNFFFVLTMNFAKTLELFNIVYFDPIRDFPAFNYS